VDRAVGVGNGRVTPAGPLRAPLAAQAPFADALVLTDAGEASARSVPAALARLPCFPVRLVPAAEGPLDGPLLAFAGIGRPQKVFDGITRLGGNVAVHRSFADHHPFTDAEVARLAADASLGGLRLVTTPKDRVRLATGSAAARRLAEEVLVVDVVAELPPALSEAILAAGLAGR
jgi:tetraacyldisaccharide 4'-kinase